MNRRGVWSSIGRRKFVCNASGKRAFRPIGDWNLFWPLNIIDGLTEGKRSKPHVAKAKNLIVAQSGGPSPVINNSLRG